MQLFSFISFSIIKDKIYNFQRGCSTMKALPLLLSLIVTSYVANVPLSVDDFGFLVFKDGFMWFQVNYSSTFPVLLTNDTLRILREEGWNVSLLRNEIVLERGNVTIVAYVIRGHECSSKSGCKIAGCSGELCVPKSSTPVNTPCFYRRWYHCFKLSKCTCINGFCSWEPTPAFKACLRENGIDPSKVLRVSPSKVFVRSSGPSDVESTVLAINAIGGCLNDNKLRNELVEVLSLRGLPHDNETLKVLLSGGKIRVPISTSSSSHGRNLCGPVAFLGFAILPLLLKLLRKI